VNDKPKKLIVRLSEFAALCALSALLLRFAVRCLLEIWWILLIVAALVAAVAVFWRVRKHGTWR
jgi:hypothetical protein